MANYIFKGTKYTDPHKAVKAFFLDTKKDEMDEILYEDYGTVTPIAGLDSNKKVWTNNDFLSNQSNIEIVRLKEAFSDIFKSIKEYMNNNNVKIENVDPTKVLPYYSVAVNGKNGREIKTYQTPEEAMDTFLKNKDSSLQYHNKYTLGGLEMAGYHENGNTWYTNLSHVISNPSVSEAKDIYDTKMEEMKKGIEFTPYYKYKNTSYDDPEMAIRAFINDDNKIPQQGVVLHHDNDFSGYSIVDVNVRGKPFLDHEVENSNIPERKICAEIYNRVLKESSEIKLNEGFDDNPIPVVEHKVDFKPFYEYKGTRYEDANIAVRAFVFDDEVYGSSIEGRKICAGIYAKALKEKQDFDLNNIPIDTFKPTPVEEPKVENSFSSYYKYKDVKYTDPTEALKAFIDDENKIPQQGVVLHHDNDFTGYSVVDVNMRGQSFLDHEVENSNIHERKICGDIYKNLLQEKTFDPENPSFPYYKVNGVAYVNPQKAIDALYENGNKNGSELIVHIDNHFMGADGVKFHANGAASVNEHSFQNTPGIRLLQKAFDNKINEYKTDLKYLDDVYPAASKVIDGYPLDEQVKDLKEMKKVIDKLPTHNVSSSDLSKIQAYKENIKNHELYHLVEIDSQKNNDVKIKQQNNNTLQNKI